MKSADQGFTEATYQRAVGKLRDLLSQVLPGGTDAAALANQE